MDNKIKHLEMIQAVIQRMANNSFQLKGWAVTLVGVIGALSTAQDNKRFFILAFIPIFAFWGLDSFYLQLERKFTVLYKTVVNKREEDVNFDMDLRTIIVSDVDKKRLSFWNCVFSKSELWFYGPVTIAILVLAYFLIKHI